MKVILGLGNPGLRYKNTRHNAGFFAIDAIADAYGIKVKKKGFHGVYGEGRIAGSDVMLLKPVTYMNLSGEAVKAIHSSKLKRLNANLLVIVDDINLPLGSVRLREKGSAGGHNGLKSIIEAIGQDFSRLRIGIASGENKEKFRDLSSFVLAPFLKKEREILNGLSGAIIDYIEKWIIGSPDRSPIRGAPRG